MAKKKKTTDIEADEKIIADKSQSNRSPSHPHPELTDHPFWPCKYKYKCKYKCKYKYKLDPVGSSVRYEMMKLCTGSL